MFEQVIDQPYRRRGLSRRGWAYYVSSCLILSIIAVFALRHFAEKYARIAERETVVSGVINSIRKAKGQPADYTFDFENVQYVGHDDSQFLNLTVGKTTKVFVDPQNPQVNGLRSFVFESEVDLGFSTFLIYLAGLLTIVSTILWLRVLNGKEMINTEEGL